MATPPPSPSPPFVYHIHTSYCALPAGFTFNFARMEGVWGAGTYYSCNPSLAMTDCIAMTQLSADT